MRWALASPLRRWPCWPGPYSRLLKGLRGRPQMFSPIRRSILYFASARFVIAIPLKIGPGYEERALLMRSKSADRLSAEQGLKATGASNDKRALVPESAPEVAASLERRTAAVKSV